MRCWAAMSAELSERDLAEGVGGKELLSVLLLQGLVPVERRELEHALALPVGEQAEQIAQITPGLDAVHLAAGQERDEGRIGFGPLVAPEEKPIFPSDRLAAQLELAAVVVKREPPVVEEARERLALVHRVTHGLRHRRVVEHLVLLPRAPLEEALHERLRVLGPDRLTLSWWRLGQLSLEIEQTPDVGECLPGVLGLRAQGLEEVASAMTPASDLHHAAVGVEVVVDSVGV